MNTSISSILEANVVLNATFKPWFSLSYICGALEHLSFCGIKWSHNPSIHSLWAQSRRECSYSPYIFLRRNSRYWTLSGALSSHRFKAKKPKTKIIWNLSSKKEEGRKMYLQLISLPYISLFLKLKSCGKWPNNYFPEWKTTIAIWKEIMGKGWMQPAHSQKELRYQGSLEIDVDATNIGLDVSDFLGVESLRRVVRCPEKESWQNYTSYHSLEKCLVSVGSKGNS